MQMKEFKVRPISSINCCPSNESIQSTFGKTAKDFLVHVTPSVQTDLCNNEEISYFGAYPTLRKLNEVYGKNTAKAWVIPELVDLSEYCGAKDKITNNQISQCADIIANDYSYLKVSELLLFFGKFKRCCYGRFYGSVDPLIITEALREFCRERNVAYYNMEQAESQKLFAESISGTCSWEEYAKSSGQAGKPMPTMYLQEKSASSHPTSRKEKEDVVYEVASALVKNSYLCDKATLHDMKTMFVNKYGLSPEDYICHKDKIKSSKRL